jgi:hypothetical protein
MAAQVATLLAADTRRQGCSPAHSEASSPGAMVILGKLRDARTAGEILFLGVPVRVFLEETVVSINGLSEEARLPQCECECAWVASNLFRA